MWLLFSTYFIIFLQEYSLCCLFNNSIVLLMSIKLPYVCRIFPAVLSRYTFRIIITKVSQDLAFIVWMPGDMYESCGFGFILRIIYISFPMIASTLTHIRVSIWQGWFSSHYHYVTSTVGIFPSMFFIKKVLLHLHK